MRGSRWTWVETPMPKNNRIDRRMSAERLENDEEIPLCPFDSGAQPPSVGNYARLDRFMRVEEVLYVTGMSCSTLYRKIGRGTFPRQVNLGVNMVAWRESQIADWMQNPT